MLTKHLFKIAIRNGFSAETELISKPIVETIFLFFKFVRAFIFDSQKVRNLIQLRRKKQSFSGNKVLRLVQRNVSGRIFDNRQDDIVISQLVTSD